MRKEGIQKLFRHWWNQKERWRVRGSLLVLWVLLLTLWYPLTFLLEIRLLRSSSPFSCRKSSGLQHRAVFCMLFSTGHQSNSWEGGCRCSWQSRWERSAGKAGVSSGWYQPFSTRADVGKCSSEWKGHCNCSAAESASVCLVNQHRVFPMSLHLCGISWRLVRHQVCWPAEQVKFKSCLLLNWYLGLSWAAAARDDGCSPFWFCFVQVMTLAAFCSRGLSVSPLLCGLITPPLRKLGRGGQT